MSLFRCLACTQPGVLPFKMKRKPDRARRKLPNGFALRLYRVTNNSILFITAALQ